MNAEYQRLKAKASAFRQQVQELGGLRWSIGLFGSSCQSAWRGSVSVFIDESHDADHVLSQSAFEPVWQVLKALRAYDRRLADELDQPRLSLGKRSKSGGRISLPDNIRLDVPRLLLHDFEQAFYVRTVEQTTDNPPLSVEQILTWMDAHKTTKGDWPNQNSGPVIGTAETWMGINSALRIGCRGLPGGSSLAKLLAEHRGVRDRRSTRR